MLYKGHNPHLAMWISAVSQQEQPGEVTYLWARFSPGPSASVQRPSWTRTEASCSSEPWLEWCTCEANKNHQRFINVCFLIWNAHTLAVKIPTNKWLWPPFSCNMYLIVFLFQIQFTGIRVPTAGSLLMRRTEDSVKNRLMLPQKYPSYM